MRAERNWYFFTVAIAALSLGFDAAAQRPDHLLQKVHDLKPAWAGPVFPGRSAGGSNNFSPTAGGQSSGPVAPAPTAPADRSSSISRDTPAHGGNMPDKSNRGGGHGKDKPDAPGENLQAHAGEAIPQAKPLREIPTCW
jgi:hypothetical protein